MAVEDLSIGGELGSVGGGVEGNLRRISIRSHVGNSVSTLLFHAASLVASVLIKEEAIGFIGHGENNCLFQTNVSTANTHTRKGSRDR